MKGDVKRCCAGPCEIRLDLSGVVLDRISYNHETAIESISFSPH